MRGHRAEAKTGRQSTGARRAGPTNASGGTGGGALSRLQGAAAASAPAQRIAHLGALAAGGVAQRLVLEENEDRTGYDQVDRASFLHTIDNDPDPRRVPQMSGVLDDLLSDPVRRETEGKAREYRRLIGNALVAEYRAQAQAAAPAVWAVLSSDSRKDRLALYYGLTGRSLHDLNTLTRDVLAHPHVNAVSVRANINKFIGPEPAPNGVLRNAERANFRNGTIGNFIGLVGELNAMMDTFLHSGGDTVHMGRDVPVGGNQTQDVDIFHQSGGAGYNIEVAATVGKLRDKLGSAAQRERYDQIRQHDRDQKLLYAVGDRHVWPEIFAGDHLVMNLVQYRRTLQVDGVRWGPDDLRRVRAKYNRFNADFLSHLPGGRQDTARRHLAEMNPATFAAQPLATTQRDLVHTGTHRESSAERGRKRAYTPWYERASDDRQQLRDAYAYARRVFDRRGDRGRVCTAMRTILGDAWRAQEARVDAEFERLVSLTFSNDVAAYRAAVRRVARALRAAQAALSAAADAMVARGKQRSGFYEKLGEDAQTEIKAINPATYDRLTGP